MGLGRVDEAVVHLVVCDEMHFARLVNGWAEENTCGAR
jgi:hypothetical protein